jgi:basic amino acid/polyamine antiporter, APA family
MAAARDNLFPKAFAKISSRGTPAFGLLVSSSLITMLLLMTVNDSLVKQFTFIILLATLSTLIPYLFTSMAELLIFLKQPHIQQLKRLRFPIAIAILAMAYVFWAIAGAGMQVVYYGTLLLFSSIPIYVWMQWHAKRT